MVSLEVIVHNDWSEMEVNKENGRMFSDRDLRVSSKRNRTV